MIVAFDICSLLCFYLGAIINQLILEYHVEFNSSFENFAIKTHNLAFGANPILLSYLSGR